MTERHISVTAAQLLRRKKVNVPHFSFQGFPPMLSGFRLRRNRAAFRQFLREGDEMDKTFAFDIHGFSVSVTLNDKQRATLAEIIPLKREWDSLRGFSTPDVLYAEDIVLDFVVSTALQKGHTLDEALQEELEYLRLAIEHEKELRGDVPTRTPSPDEPEQKADAVSNAEKAASDEVDEHRKAARRAEPTCGVLDCRYIACDFTCVRPRWPLRIGKGG